MDRNLAFIASAHETYEVPKEKKYLLKYFNTPIQEAYLKYVLLYKSDEHFIHHTGHYCQERWLKILRKKLKKIEDAHKVAKSSMDLSELAKIEKGKFKIS